MNLVLLSGGMDSALCLSRFGAALAVGFDYGQNHLVELDYAEKVAAHYKTPFVRVSLPEMPKVNDVVFSGRNAVLLAHGVSMAQQRGFTSVMIGCNFSDSLRFADCRPTFIRSIDSAMTAAYGVRVFAPLLSLTKAQIVKACEEEKVPQTWTCYTPTSENKQCGVCHSCKGLQ